MKKLFFIPMITIFGLLSCSKEKKEMLPAEKVQMTYKIQPAKIGELKGFAEALRAGKAVRITEETYSEDEFWLYAEAIVNSLVVEFSLTPEITQERNLSVNPQVTEFNTTNLLQVINDFQVAIQTDLTEVTFDTEGTPYAHVVDVRWEQGGSIELLYIAGITSGVSFNPNLSYQMSWASNSTCDEYALNGYMQSIMYNYWSSQASIGAQYRPNYLYSPPLWNHNYIPCCWTYTEVETRTIDFADQNQRQYYQVGPYLQLWHRTMLNATAAPVCLPDLVQIGDWTWPRTVAGHANGTAFTGMMLNPNQYSHFFNPNGLVLVGFAITPESKIPELANTVRFHPQQMEHWHKLTFSYGRQISTTGSNE
ncbi:MAG: hypothetical protein Q8J69_11290 [Sphingobacteriaceae bacterium]|nr:hypothetical protein [Sphingobacteriaceae bacterium]